MHEFKKLFGFASYLNCLDNYYGLTEQPKKNPKTFKITEKARCKNCHNCIGSVDKKKKTTYRCNIKNIIVQPEQVACWVR